MFMTHDSVISLLGISSKENKQRGNSCTRIFITELFTIIVKEVDIAEVSEQRTG